MKTRKLLIQHYSHGSTVAALKSIHLGGTTTERYSPTLQHTHDYYEIVVVVRGEGNHWINGQEIPLHIGQIFLLRPGETHYYEGFQHLVLQNFMFTGKSLRFLPKLQSLPGYHDFFQNPAKQPKLLVSSAVVSEFESLLQSIAHENQKKSYQNELLLFSCLAQLLGRLLEYQNPSVLQSAASEGLQTAIAFMMQKYSNKISLSELTQFANMSQSTFCRKFLKEFGLSPMEWLLRYRIRKAMVLLMQPAKSITEVAYACGFSDSLYFSRQFRAKVGCSPRQFRLYGQGRMQIIKGENLSEEPPFLCKRPFSTM